MLPALFSLVACLIMILFLPRDPDHWRLRCLVLEKQLQVLRRSLRHRQVRVRWRFSDRCFLAFLVPFLKKISAALVIIRPETVLQWHRKLLKRRWTFRHRPGRKSIAPSVRELVLSIKTANRYFGLTKIQGELAKLGIILGRTTIQRILHGYRRTGDLQPWGTWKQFLKAHWDSLFACDFLTVDGALGQCWYVFFLVQLKTRKIVQWGVTDHPNRTFLRQQFLNLTETHLSGGHVIHDHGPELMGFPFAEYGFTGHPTCIASPNLNAYAERFVRSVRTECLDHFIVFTEKQLGTLMKQYVEHYNNRRPHQGIGNRIPSGCPPALDGVILSRPAVSGLVRDFYRSV